ncbi:hypothetical protein BGZ96_012743 [Linnemannia gamsii]|uniref:F-box domain-containing protein n=1 Tax=Linnemannia gamsii TaxID=64522 RepID=A0ABQ7JPU2_9FUNG|nr:hypothetical protein BGZ96_012743 [Linnemannia gamsii]
MIGVHSNHLPTKIPTETTTCSSAIDIVFSVSELTHLIVKHLQPSDIRSGILVNRHWNQHLTPFLWYTLNTLFNPWQQHFRNYDRPELLPSPDIAPFIREMIARHGRHVRHVTVDWNIVLEALSVNSGCTHLTSLVVGQIMYHRTTEPLTVKTLTEALPHPPATVLIATDVTATPSVQWLHLPWISNINVYRSGVVKEDLRRKITVERFWALVRQNPGLLQLKLPYLGPMNDLSKEYMIDTLLALKELRDLDLELTLLDARMLLCLFPKLERLRIYNFDGLLTLPAQEQYGHLRSLGLRTYVMLSHALKVLDHLPGLDELWIKGIAVEPIVKLRAAMASHLIVPKAQGEAVALPLIRSFHIDEVLLRDDESLALFVRRFPRLVEYRAAEVSQALSKVLWDYCYFLDDMNGDEEASDMWRRRRLEDERKQRK